MGDFVGHSLGSMQLGPILNKSGIDHVSHGLASPGKAYSMANLGKDLQSYTQAESKGIMFKNGNFSQHNITEMTYEETASYQPNIVIVILALLLAGLIFVAALLSFIIFRETLTSLKTYCFRLMVSTDQTRTDTLQRLSATACTENAGTASATENDGTAYSTILIEEMNHRDSKHVTATDGALGSSDNHHQANDYSRLKRNYGNRINSDERGSSHLYDSVEFNTENRNKVYSVTADTYSVQYAFPPDMYIIHFPEVF
ncbi:uncharacterized protein LOC133176888 isoform X1 [Saccostrea echinata]|uniref:uncharacterized protein LOC133176888 isoform X1 n=1 Tax=Saccostrea echinata TaxID=191078 RepID=UPI002A82266D|nr:uncharacterized protein LOC133176888 isoform X1 [Saccostrea echinata]